MCGIAGCFDPAGLAPESLDRLEAMRLSMAHRGPDGTGHWADMGQGIALAHCRLAIVDLTESGAQPMTSANGRFVITFNGEIYNHKELRSALDAAVEGARWRGSSDTEVFLEAISVWGLEGALEKAVGMFAFGLWDRSQRALVLVRDRIGEKPLYYVKSRGQVVFASELKALTRFLDTRPSLDREAIESFLRYGYIGAPRTVYEGIRKLEAAHYVVFAAHSGCDDSRPRRYWSPLKALTSVGTMRPQSIDEAVDRVEAALRRTISEQMIADVPLGAFLSGGIDSSTVVALMQQESRRPVRTFTIGFDESDYDEAAHARRIAERLGTEHTEMRVTAADALQVIPELPRIYDEPFADSSQIPTLLLSRLTRRHVTVSLSGDGGDEVFGGYNRYLFARNWWPYVTRVPLAARRRAGPTLRSIEPAKLGSLYAAVERFLPENLKLRLFAEKLQKFAFVLDCEDIEDAYERLTAQSCPGNLMTNGRQQAVRRSRGDMLAGIDDPVAIMTLRDLLSYLPDDILVKVDRATMSASLESRAPFLDHRIVELGLQLPTELKIADRVGKRVLRAILHKYLPREMFERPKMGFGVPIEHWLRGPLKNWASDLLEEQRLREDALVDASAVTQMLGEHFAGVRNHHHCLWALLSLYAWLDLNSVRP